MLEDFIKTIVKNRKVYYLWLGDSYAIFISKIFYLSENYRELPIVYYWDEAAKAEACKVEDWIEGEVKSLSLEEFIGNCFEMHNETMIAGINFNTDLSVGEEAVPMDVVKQLVAEIERTHTPVSFTGFFDSLADVKKTANEIMPDIEEEEPNN